MTVSSAVAPDNVDSDAGGSGPWHLAAALSLVTHAGLFILMAILIPSSPRESRRLPKPPIKFQLAQASLLERDVRPFEPVLNGETEPVGYSHDPGGEGTALSFPSSEVLDDLIPPELALPGWGSRPATGKWDLVGSHLTELHRSGSSNATSSNVTPSNVITASSNSFSGASAGRQTSMIPSGIDVEAIIREDRLRTASRKPAGQPARVSLYGAGASEGRSFVFLIDQSKSTASQGTGTLLAAEKELLVALGNLQPHHRFQVIAYHDRCHYLHRRELLLATEENKQAVSGFINGLVSQGATEHEMALSSALQHEPDVIYLLTDGGDPPLTESQIRRITGQAGGRTSIHCVGFGYGPPPLGHEFLKKLAARNGGGYCYVNLSRESSVVTKEYSD